jgi:hypothetical protein
VRGEDDDAGESTVFWEGLGLVMAQFEGLVAGYKLAVSAGRASGTLDEALIYLLNSVGDLETLNGLFSASLRRTPPNSYRFSDCSGLVKVVDGDAYLGHTTWRSYYAMLRVFAVWDLSYTAARLMTASSSPGFLHSKDDAYSTGAGLAVFETTNSDMNGTRVAEFVMPQSVLTWQRAAVACQQARSGVEWAGLFAMNQSSTYNNQWVIADAKLFFPKLQPGALWVLAQTSGLVISEDQTALLAQQSYWPSYNIPFYQQVYNVSGYPAAFAKYGNDYSYSQCPRALIFARNQSAVYSFQDMQALMRYNQWKTDPLSNQDPVLGAVSARADFDPSPAAFGGVDAKVISLRALADGDTLWAAVSGPTTQGQPPFSWLAPPFVNITRNGVPDTFDFPWISVAAP